MGESPKALSLVFPGELELPVGNSGPVLHWLALSAAIIAVRVGTVSRSLLYYFSIMYPQLLHR